MLLFGWWGGMPSYLASSMAFTDASFLKFQLNLLHPTQKVYTTHRAKLSSQRIAGHFNQWDLKQSQIKAQ